MTALILKLLVDCVMVFLLGATIFYCLKVNKRIRVLQDSREEFAKLITQFDSTTKKAQESIEDLQRMSARVTDSLNERLDKANFLADDLAFMIEKGNKVAEKVDGTLPREQRMGKTALPPKRESSVGRSKKKTGDDARESLMKVAGKPRGAAGADKATKADKGKKDKVESMLERLGDKKGATGEKRPRRSGRTSARLRSRAEQELQDALETGSDS